MAWRFAFVPESVSLPRRIVAGPWLRFARLSKGAVVEIVVVRRYINLLSLALALNDREHVKGVVVPSVPFVLVYIGRLDPAHVLVAPCLLHTTRWARAERRVWEGARVEGRAIRHGGERKVEVGCLICRFVDLSGSRVNQAVSRIFDDAVS